MQNLGENPSEYAYFQFELSLDHDDADVDLRVQRRQVGPARWQLARPERHAVVVSVGRRARRRRRHRRPHAALAPGRRACASPRKQSALTHSHDT